MNGKNILITGANGLLGSCLVKNIPGSTGYSSKFLDITNELKVQEVISRVKPDIIIHAAAYTDVDECEINVDKAFKINTIGTHNVVLCCKYSDILFVYISSTGVYGSYKNKSYTEYDKAIPTTVHHKSKFDAEAEVQRYLNKYIIIRTGWLFGGDKYHVNNFIYNRYKESKKHKIIYSDNSQIGNPTYINNLVKQINVLINSNQYGIFNCVNEAINVSRFDYVKKIVELFNVDCKVKIAPDGYFDRLAPVSKNESALNYKLDLAGLNIMESWDSGLKEYIDNTKHINEK
jgi:dTDP-4-dehydrorhamnose reductase